MVDPGTITAIATTVGVTATISYGFFRIINSKADKVTTTRIFKLTDVQGKEIAEMGKGVAAMGKDVEHLTATVREVSKDVKEILRNGQKHVT